MMQQEMTKNMVQAGELLLNLEKSTLYREEAEFHLTPIETRLLAVLMANVGQIVTRDKLLEEVWHTDDPRHSRTLDVHIHWLRQKVEVDPNIPEYILTRRGLGYELRVG